MADENTTPDNVVEMRASAAAESLRISAIARACRGEFHDIQAKAIAEGWTESETELAVIRAARQIIWICLAPRPSATFAICLRP